jgi:hypothetical protein
MSASGHWPSEGLGLEHIVGALKDLRQSASENYEQEIKKEIGALQSKIAELESVNATTEVQELKRTVFRLQQATLNKFTEFNVGMKDVETKLQELIESQDKNLKLEQAKLQIEYWKLVVTIIVAFLSGLILPLITRSLGLIP